MGSLHTAAPHLRAQGGEVDVEVVVGRLVVEVDTQLAGGKSVALQDGLLGHTETETERVGTSTSSCPTTAHWFYR